MFQISLPWQQRRSG